jgi:pSer/pThr/pTyr-binding forkhead associated (FHA) protein
MMMVLVCAIRPQLDRWGSWFRIKWIPEFSSAGAAMSEEHLNSVHLDAGRRDEFRRARENLLEARGLDTLNAESRSLIEQSQSGPNTVVQGASAVPKGVKFFLLDKSAIYPLKVGVNTIGRLPDNDVVIEDGHVSRRHCAIVVHTRDNCELHDVASKNGTYINGEKMAQPTRLNSGDEIRMCDHTVVFLTKQDDSSRNSPPKAPENDLCPTVLPSNPA